MVASYLAVMRHGESRRPWGTGAPAGTENSVLSAEQLTPIIQYSDTVAKSGGARIETGHPVSRILFEGRRAVGVEIEGRRHAHDHVVVNADATWALKNLIPEELRGRQTDERLDAMRYSCSTFMLYLGIDGTVDLPHHTIYISSDYRGNLRDIEEGRQLSDAMKRHPRVFNSVFVSMIKAGETSGYLKQILDRIVEMQEKRQALIAQLRSTLTYPALLCIVGALVVIFVLVGVLPKFTAFFAGKEHILPPITRFLMALSDSLRGYWWAYIFCCLGLAVGIKLWKESDSGQALVDRLSVSTPVVSGLYNKIYTCQFLRTLGHLMASQVPLLEALQASKGTVRNRYFIRFVDQIMAHVQQGGRFAEPFAANPYILDSVKQMVSTGEEAGNLPKVMLRLAEFYDEEVDRELKSLASMIEPLALVVLGGVVGCIVASVILPVFRLAHAVY